MDKMTRASEFLDAFLYKSSKSEKKRIFLKKSVDKIRKVVYTVKVAAGRTPRETISVIEN